MKITKLLPLAFALALISPAFAVTGDKTTDQVEFTLSVPEFISITKVDADTQDSATVDSIGTDQTSIHLDHQLKTKFHVATNKPGDQITLTAKTNGKEALWGSAAAPVLVFTNENPKAGSVSESAIQKAGELEDASLSKNAIGFPITRTITPDTDTGAVVIEGEGSRESFANNTITYTLENGVYDFAYVLNQEINSTVSALDEAGTYSATLTMTHVTN